MPHRLRKLYALALTGLLACGGGDAADAAASTRGAVAAGEQTARQAVAMPATGLWSEAHLMDRLVRTGLAPRTLESPAPAAEWMQRPPVALAAGGGEIFAWIYEDSSARRRVTEALDPETAAPRGTASPFAPPMRFIVQNNLALVVRGGTLRNIERVQLAIEAGLPVTP